jgi:regulator of replication initiation timing/FtsZ-binding cell division protein ZapB
MRRFKFAPWVLVLSLSISSVANAGCCDDFWSCVATVATAGVSCQVQQLIDTIKALSVTVNVLFNDMKTRTADIINDAKNQVVQSAEDIKQEREKALADLGNAANSAHSINNPPILTGPLAATKVNTSAVAAVNPAVAPVALAPQMPNAIAKSSMQLPPAPADPAAVKAALKQAETYVQDLKTKGATVSDDAAAAERRARDAVLRHVVLANKIALDIGLQPLKLLGEGLVDLLTHPERIFDPSAQIEADLRRMSQEVPALLDRIGNEVTEEAARELELAQGPTKQLLDQAAVARSVSDAMQKVASSKLQLDLEGLNRLLPNTAPQKVSVLRGVTLPVGIAGRREILASALGRLEVTKLPLIAKHRASVSSVVTQWDKFKLQTKAAVTIDASTDQKATSQVSQAYRGKSKTEIEKKRQELIEEAKRRFAKDPKTLEKVTRYLETHG